MLLEVRHEYIPAPMAAIEPYIEIAVLAEAADLAGRHNLPRDALLVLAHPKHIHAVADVEARAHVADVGLVQVLLLRDHATRQEDLLQHMLEFDKRGVYLVLSV